jgi:hypothetical protein
LGTGGSLVKYAALSNAVCMRGQVDPRTCLAQILQQWHRFIVACAKDLKVNSEIPVVHGLKDALRMQET